MRYFTIILLFIFGSSPLFSQTQGVENQTACEHFLTSNWCLGWEFTADADITVSALGIYDENQDGLVSSHDVGIYDVATQALLGQVTVPAGTTGTLVGESRYEDLAVPVNLTAGQNYIVTAVHLVGGGDRYGARCAAPQYNDVTWVNASFSNSTTLVYPAFTALEVGYYGGNFLQGSCEGVALGDDNYFMRSASGGYPWGQTALIQSEMNATVGVGNWTEEFFETGNAATIFSTDTRFVYMDGSQAGSEELEAFLIANLPAIEAWVDMGGRLFLNCAPNSTARLIDFGFGGVQLNYNPTLPPAGSFHAQVIAADVAHPVWAGPNLPTTTGIMSGNYWGHAIICPPGMNAIVVDDTRTFDVIAEVEWGAGCAIFGGMTTTNFHSPQPQAPNFKLNLLDYLNTKELAVNCGDEAEYLVCPPDTIVDCTSPIDTMTLGRPLCTEGGPGELLDVYWMTSGPGTPWGQENRIRNEMNMVFGAGNWMESTYQTGNPATIFSAATSYVYLEGGSTTANELNTFLQANLPAIEAWVDAGGLLFINAAPNEGGDINFGFGGVTLNYPSFTPTVVATDPAHPIWQGPFLPTATTMTGNFYGHAVVCPNPMTSIIQDNGRTRDVLVETEWGRGHVMFGGMTTTNFHRPQPQATNIKWNMHNHLLNQLPAGGGEDTIACRGDIDFEDRIIPGICSDTLIRTFFLYNEGDTIFDQCDQIILLSDLSAPEIVCQDAFLFAKPGMCEIYGVDLTVFGSVTDFCDPNVEIEESADNPYFSGDIIPIGVYEICLIGEDECENRDTCCYILTVDEFQNPTTALSCNDNVQLSLDSTCMVTVGADQILEGGPYGCYDNYIVKITDDRGNEMDMDTSMPGIQLGWPHNKKCFTAEVTDPRTGNVCWGKVCVEDKTPPILVCVDDTVACDASSDPGAVALPTLFDACDPFPSLTYVDWVTDGSCATGYERIISRRWTATDNCGNSVTCEQTILVELGSIFDVAVPGDYDDLSRPALECDEKYDADKVPDDLGTWDHVLDFPLCVDGYLLDSAHWFATGGNLTLPAGLARDLSGERLPMSLGWNCIDAGPYEGHPSPHGTYYDEHPQWSLFFACWGPNQIQDWIGTGVPSGAGCSNLNYTYRDTKINVADPDCNAGEVGCFKVLRQWTVLDWCTGEVGGHDQIIKVLDKKAPEILMPDVLEVGTDVWKCEGVARIPAPWITDNCSEDLEYRLTIKTGTVTGDAVNGYAVVGLELGEHTLYVEVDDCCGNTGVDSIILQVVDNTPPVCISEDRVQLSLAGSQSPGTNFSAICAEDLNQASYDNCTQWLWYKMIRVDELLGTANGSFADNTVACSGINGDDDGLQPGNQVYFDDCAKFCCDDADQIILVVLRVHDVDPGAGPVSPIAYTPPAGSLVGHFTDCWVEIDVRDKAQPIVVAPPDMVVSCMFWFDDSDDALSDPDNPTFGRVVMDLGDRQKVKTWDIVCEAWCEDHPKYDYEPSRMRPVIASTACDYYNDLYDSAHPDDKYELVWGYDGYVIRTCGISPTIRANDQRECGQGLITRDVTVSYPSPHGGATTYRDRQEIWVIDCDPFFINNDNCFDDEDCIQWPIFCQQPQPLDGCGADIDPYTNPQLGYPVVENGCDDNCALIAVEYEDERFTIEDTACFKIIRTWTVIDWCTYDPFDFDPDEPVGRWEWVQVIVVRDQIDPVLTAAEGDFCDPLTFVRDSVYGCIGHIELCGGATDDCSPNNWLVYDYKIDMYSDGVGAYGDFDLYVGKLTELQYDRGQVLDCESKSAYDQACYYNPFADDPTQPFCASGVYPTGIHTIYWFAEDGCGNVSKIAYEFEIKDCKEPTPYCKNGIITVVMPANGEICVWASDLDDGSFDNCTADEDLKFYFDGNAADSVLCWDCDDFEAAGADDKLLVDVEVWVEDEAGNADFCKTTIEIQDNMDICNGTGSISFGGGVENAMMQEGVQDVEMFLNGDMEGMTDNLGGFAFVNLALNSDYVIAPAKNDDPLNGVNTSDLVAIQRYLLGKLEFTTAYQYIAADINNSESISASDIAGLRKLILGSTADFNDPLYRGQESWRFIDKGYVFTDFENPWGWTESVESKEGNHIVGEVNFHAVKIGDITGDAQNNGLTGNVTRGNGTLTFATADARVSAGDQYRMDVTADNFTAIAGYQFTMQYDASVEFAGLESGALTVSNENVGVSRMNEGLITMSWNTLDSETYASDEVLFTIVLDVINTVQLSEAINVNSTITKAEAYEVDLSAKGLALNFRDGGATVTVFELYQNIPNPFKTGTVIGFNLPEAMPAVLTIYDVAGKVLMVSEIDGQRGYNETTMTKAQLNGAGVLYYQLDAANHTATKRMILVD